MSNFLPKICQTTILIFSFVLPLTLWGLSKEGEELKILDELIATSERQISLQKELKVLITDFYAQQELFYQGPEKGQQTKELATKMVKTAVTILTMAENNHYLHLFSPFFVEELRCFAGIAKKNTPPAPSISSSAPRDIPDVDKAQP
jgi:hypothetical protein